MEREEKYRLGSLANFTREQLEQAQANFQRSAQRYPEEHARIADLIREKGLGNHREVVGHYAQTFYPMSGHQLRTIDMYKDTSYAGAYGRGKQVEDKDGNRLTGSDALFPSANRTSSVMDVGGPGSLIRGAK